VSHSTYALVFASGGLTDGPAVRAALARSGPRLVIAADGGLHHAAALGLRADVVIGDLDSVTEGALQAARDAGAEIIRHRAEKDETDLELALVEAAARGADPIRILGAAGGRLDHLISNVYLLALPQLAGRDVQLVDKAEAAWLAHPGTHDISGQPGDTLSLVPLAGDAEGIRTEGLYYPLRGETLRFGPARGTSNVMTSAVARVSFERGLLLIIHIMGKAE
jgi:thiamine pyrophosphokinase